MQKNPYFHLVVWEQTKISTAAGDTGGSGGRPNGLCLGPFMLAARAPLAPLACKVQLHDKKRLFFTHIACSFYNILALHVT